MFKKNRKFIFVFVFFLIYQIRSSLNNKNIDSNEPKSNDTNYINIQQQQQQFKVNKTVEDRLNQLINRISNTFENKNVM